MEKPIDIQLTIYTYSEADLEKSNLQIFSLRYSGVDLVTMYSSDSSFFRVLHVYVYVSQTSKCCDFTFLMKKI